MYEVVPIAVPIIARVSMEIATAGDGGSNANPSIDADERTVKDKTQNLRIALGDENF